MTRTTSSSTSVKPRILRPERSSETAFSESVRGLERDCITCNGQQGGLFPAVYVRILAFTARLAIGTEGNKVKFPVLSRVLVVVVPAPWVLES